MSEEKKVIHTPIGRVINHSVFEMDKFNDKANASYKIELAFDDNEELDDLYKEMYDFAVATWGAGADAEDAPLVIPLKDGNKMADKREKDGKNGDAYKGKIVLRANTIYNQHGENAPGGLKIVNENSDGYLEFSEHDKFYRGCEARIALTLKAYMHKYKVRDGEEIEEPAITCYISAVQYCGPGERLAGERDDTKLFAPVGRDQEGGSGGRKRRAG